MGVGLSTAMWSGVTGLLANSTKMSSIGNNLANVNTVGFKSARTDFVTLMSQNISTASGTDQIGTGTRVGNVVTDYSQGGLETTSSSTDMAVSGNGFFMVKQKSLVGSNGNMINSGNSTMYYTRAGDFNFDSDGYLVTSTGLAVQGWRVDQDKVDSASATGTMLSQVPTTGAVQDIKLDTFSAAAKATSTVSLITNLDTDASSATARASNASDTFYAMSESWNGLEDPAMASTAYAYQSTIKVYDAKGSAHVLTVYYDKATSKDGNEYWEYAVTCDPSEDGRTLADGTRLASSSGGGLLMVGTIAFDSEGAMTNMSAYTLSSNATAADVGSFKPTAWTAASISSDGYPEFTANFQSVSNASFTNQANAKPISLNFGIRSTAGWTASGASLATVTSDPSTLNQYNPAKIKKNSNITTNSARPSSVLFSSQNGYTAGTLTSISVDKDGVVTGTFSNGQTQALWVVALADFSNTQGLTSVGNSLYLASQDSGQPTVNRANSGSVGSIAGNSLEDSNVDMASEMVSMILTQRGFEANSKTITTVDSMLSEIIQLKR